MLLSPKWEKQGLGPQSHPHKIVHVPLPSQQAMKILRNLQANCSSSNKSVQLEALQCWDAWICSHELKEWEIDSVCHFAVKPLMTKKLQPLHKDSDICKLKLNIMWKLLVSVQIKMVFNGPKYILDIFLQSCFTWLASVEHLENEVSNLILKLLLALFQNDKGIIIQSEYTFSSLQLDKSILEKVFFKYTEKFIDIIDNWKKIHNNGLIIDLWKWFLDQCEQFHSSMTTTIWHRIFKVNQAFCSEKDEPVKEKLIFLHACATKVKTVLSSSKYIGGESCFITPCEALLKKLSEICRIDTSENAELFKISEETCRTLAYKSIEICDYDLCIQFLDLLEDFSLRSFFWGCWCGLVDCYIKFLLPLNHSHFTKKQMKFYRKLRAPTVNFELDKTYLIDSCVNTVYNKFKALRIECFCHTETVVSFDNLIHKSIIDLPFLKPPEGIYTNNDFIKNDESKFDVIQSQECKLISVPNTSNLIGKPLSDGKKLFTSLYIDFGNFGNFDSQKASRVFLNSYKFQVDFNFLKNISSTFQMDKFNFFANRSLILHFSALNRNDKSNLIINFNKYHNKYLCTNDESVTGSKKNRIENDPAPKKIEKNIKNAASKSVRKRRSRLSSNTDMNSSMQEENLASRTRSRIKLISNLDFSKQKKNRKSFEMVVQEILQKNKMRKTEKQCGESEKLVKPKRELRSKKNTLTLKKQQQKLNITKKEEKKKIKDGKKTTGNLSRTASEKEEIIRTTSERKSIENYNKIISYSNSDKKVKANVNSKKCKASENKIRKRSKKSNNRHQILFKTTVRNEKLENIGSEFLNSDPLRKFYHDHEYAKGTHTCQLPLDECNFAKILMKRPTELVKNDSETSEVENIDPNYLGTLEGISQVVKNKRWIKFDKEITYEKESSTEDEKPFSKEKTLFPIQNLAEEKRSISVNCSNHLRLPEQLENTTNNSISVVDLEIYEKKLSLSQEKEPFETSDQVEELTDVLKNKEYESYSEKVTPTKTVLKEELISKSRKRLLPLECDDIGSKKLRLEDGDSEDGIAVLCEIISPEKTNCKIEISSSKEKIESSPSQISKLTNRAISSRASRMIALIPQSEAIGGQPTKGDSPTHQNHFLNVSPKLDLKERNKKFAGADRSSRVSKMLASLSLGRQSVKNVEESIEEDKRNGSEVVVAATPEKDLIAKTVSPKSAKKRKFIGFDESKNQTVIYRINTPPSQILQEWKLLKEEYLNVLETEPE